MQRAIETRLDELSRIEVFQDPGRPFSGALRHTKSGRAWVFRSEWEFIRLIEAVIESNRFPQAAQKLRAFGRGKASATNEKGLDDMGKRFIKAASGDIKTDRPTFIIKVYSRQNASWQGSIQWVEGGEQQNFRSLLELIRLMDSVIEPPAEE